MDLPQFEYLSKALNSSIPRRRVVKALAATAVGGTLALGVIGKASARDFGTASWQPLIMGTPITGLAFRITTGSDDLRGTEPFSLEGPSTVDATVVIANRMGTKSISLLIGSGSWPNGSVNDAW